MSLNSAVLARMRLGLCLIAFRDFRAKRQSFIVQSRFGIFQFPFLNSPQKRDSFVLD